MDYIWGASIVETYLCMMIDIWEFRNKEVHTEKKRQQSRKSKKIKQLSV